jgi:hypothetical protein
MVNLTARHFVVLIYSTQSNTIKNSDERHKNEGKTRRVEDSICMNKGSGPNSLSLSSLLHPPIFSCFSPMHERRRLKGSRKNRFREGKGHGKGEKAQGLFTVATTLQ